jgi:hypothetical protein
MFRIIKEFKNYRCIPRARSSRGAPPASGPEVRAAAVWILERVSRIRTRRLEKKRGDLSVPGMGG